MKWSYNPSLGVFFKWQYYRLAWLCVKRCFGSEGGHTASTNINASAASSWQKKEPTKPGTSKLIKAVLFLERQIYVSTNIASHIAPTQGNTLRWIQLLFILLGDPQKVKDEAKASSQHKSLGGTPSKNGKPRAEHWWDSTPEETTHRSETPSTCAGITHTSVSLAMRVWEHHRYLQAFPRYALQYHQVLK